DSNDNQTYDFVDGSGDPPYTEGGSAVTDAGEVTVAEAPASVTFSDQTRDGTTVTVDSVRMDEGGFVTMHDSSLLDGDAVGSVVGFSEYLAPGSYENVIVELDEQLTETQQLIAMPHRDSNDNQTYDFVDESGDPPYTEGGSAVTDAGEVTVVAAPASVTFSDQTRDGTTVTVDSVRMDEGGFVTMHDSSLLDGDAVGSVVGFSEYLAPGSYENVIVELDEQLTETQQLIAMPHRDSNDNQTYDFVDGSGDPPYTEGGSAVTDAGAVTIDTGDDVDASAPGFGVAAGLAGLGSLGAYAYKRLNLDAEPPTPAEDGLDEDEDQ
ncbi:MAG: PGF-CTERM sorting domain-containing protein, partial [Halobacteriales archaeon]